MWDASPLKHQLSNHRKCAPAQVHYFSIFKKFWVNALQKRYVLVLYNLCPHVPLVLDQQIKAPFNNSTISRPYNAIDKFKHPFSWLTEQVHGRVLVNKSYDIGRRKQCRTNAVSVSNISMEHFSHAPWTMSFRHVTGHAHWLNAYVRCIRFLPTCKNKQPWHSRSVRNKNMWKQEKSMQQKQVLHK